MLIMKSGKRPQFFLKPKGIELPNPERIKTLGEKENYKYIGILEADTRQAEMKKKKKKKRKEYLRRRKKISRDQPLQ